MNETVLEIIAKHLAIPVENLKVNRTFDQNGGNSVKLLSIIKELKQLDLEIPVELFQRPKTLNDLLNHIGNCSVKQFKRNNLTIRRFSESNQKDVLIDMFCRSFNEKNPYALAYSNPKFFSSYAQCLVDEDTKRPFSLVAYDEDSKQYVGGAFLHNYATEFDIKIEEPMLEVFNFLENPHQLKGEKIQFLYIAVAFAEPALMSSGIHLEIFRLIQPEIMKIAKDNNFVGVVAVTAHIFTQVDA